jgi:hypothetical protein
MIEIGSMGFSQAAEKEAKEANRATNQDR